VAIKFKKDLGPVKHGTQTFPPDVALAFSDDRAEEYFLATGWAEKTKDEPIITYPEGTVEVDPETVHANTGVKVLEG
jgi:hypothetical protein